MLGGKHWRFDLSKIQAQHIATDPGDEPLLRRIAKAVIWQWDSLPVEAQNLIKEQAVFIGDKDETVSLNEQISILIRKHKGPKG